MFHVKPQRAFWSLFTVQFLGALNDNLFKNLLVMWLTFEATLPHKGVWVSAAAGIFILPFVVLSPLAGQLADSLPKHRLIRWIKGSEVFIMALGVLGFILASPWLLLMVLFLMGAQSALFGPVKYSILPDFFRDEDLVAVNSWWSGSTFVAILLGTLAGTAGYAHWGAQPWLAGVLVISMVGWLAALRVPPVAAAARTLRLQWNPWRAVGISLRFARSHHAWPIMLSISLFWMLGGIVLSQIPLMAEALGTPASAAWLLMTFAIALSIGSGLAYVLHREHIHLPWAWWAQAAATLALTGVWLAFPEHNTLWWALFALAALAGGLWIVPLYVWLQRYTDAAHRGQLFAALNVMNALFMVLGAGLAMGWHALHGG